MKKLLLLVIPMILLSGCGKDSAPQYIQEESNKMNTNEEVIKETIVDGIKIDRSSLVYENGKTTLTTTLTNVSGKEIDAEHVKMKYYDADGVETILIGEIGDKLAPEEVIHITSRTDVDLTKAVKVEYELVLSNY